MSYQLQFDFESPEEKAQRQKDYEDHQAEIDATFEAENYYTYNKYIDGFIDLLPYKLGWGFKKNWYDLRWWAKCTYQKLRYGVSDDDIFSLEVNIAKYVVPRLKYFRKKGKMGIPACFLPHDFHHLEGEELDFAETKALKEMNDVLDEMIFAFEYIVDPDKFAPFPETSLAKWDSKDKNFFNREKTIEEKMAWDEYMQKCKDCEARKKKGLLLFAEYSDILWI